MGEPIDLGGLVFEPNENIEPGDMFIGRADAPPIGRRLVEAFGRGEVTEGGLAEAGWRHVGRVTDDRLTFTPNID